MKRKFCFLIIIFLIIYPVFSEEIESFQLPVIKEKEECKIYSINIENKIPYITANLIKDEKEYKTLFILDTGVAYSYLFNKAKCEIDNLFDQTYGTGKYMIVDLKCEDFYIENLALIKNEKKYVPEFSADYDLIGVLGNDVLLQKDFYISLTKKQMGWIKIDQQNFPDNQNIYFLNKIKGQRINQTIYWITVYVEDDFFNSKTYPLFMMMPEATGSRYWISTGCYEIFTSDFDFQEQLDRHNYNNTNEYDENGNITKRTMIIKKASFFGKKFKSLKASTYDGLFYGMPNVKLLGTQVLSAFDLYFSTENTTEIKQVYFIPVSNKEYSLFNK